MTDDNLDDTQPYTSTLAKFEEAVRRECGQIDLPSQLHKEIWNRAIEKAASIAEINSAADIRKLKV